MDKKLYSAIEILELGIENLPKTKIGISDKAKKEDWYFETRVGRGGTKYVYEIPARYLIGTKLQQSSLNVSSHSIAEAAKLSSLLDTATDGFLMLEVADLIYEIEEAGGVELTPAMVNSLRASIYLFGFNVTKDRARLKQLLTIMYFGAANLK